MQASLSNSTTEAGRTDRVQAEPSDEHIDAINQVFALFRINYHNQYYSAFSQVDLLNQAKRLWLTSLAQFAPQTILRGAKKVMEQSEYLPSIHRMIKACQGNPAEHGLPNSHSAYIEACQAPSPKAAFKWSHPAVFHAGSATNWYFLASSNEKDAFPIFERHYLAFCEKVINGETLPAPQMHALPETIERPLTPEENVQRMQQLRDQLGL
jgi:hypothetical protein